MSQKYSADPTKASKKMVLAIQDRNDLKYVKIKDDLSKIKHRLATVEASVKNLLQLVFE